ncbi:MAG: PepSY domain-containing protein [Candidatus Andeanibacterium colombiense]|uniref:PepSY domain-containing protein n=1 Tax=Candidatus Andeanibacterium colombiense TaxID=3121345 RepID=A0AAJ5XCM9_9SPHN|nr:MAG: PepSY domain-containing protein [Sphingomonadaceae bacterium]
MFRLLAPFAAISLAASSVVAPVAQAQNIYGDEQKQARQGVRDGAVLPLPEIERRVVPPMLANGMEYLGPSYDAVAKAYRLKFIKNGKVTFVDIDARSGRILSRSR